MTLKEALKNQNERKNARNNSNAEEYSDGGDYAEFSVGSQYGQALLELGADAFYDEETDEYDIEGLCTELGELAGYLPEDIYSVITGELEPSDKLSLSISEILELDEDTESQLLVIGIETRGESIEDYLDQDEDEEEDEEEEEEEDEDEEEDGDATYSRVHQLEEEMANFKSAEIVKDELANIELRAWQLVENGQVAPIVIEKFLGNFNNESDRVAAFSSVCTRNNTDAGTQLFALKTVIEVLESMPVIANFGFESLEEVTDEEYEEQQNVANLAAAIIKNRKSN